MNRQSITSNEAGKGAESEKNGTYVGKTEQQDRIRTQFQQPAMKYFDEFDQHLGWMVSSKKAVL